uniref:Uncharacterized protein n=1 Tax=Rhizophora mucronata TaxID=61149 RepID=A0A2P2NM29_RHIMU
MISYVTSFQSTSNLSIFIISDCIIFIYIYLYPTHATKIQLLFSKGVSNGLYWHYQTI